ncbi:MAG: uL14 family ribosomal protein [Candidatus Nanohaloarchaea archaeon]|nr:uL14 family ribosomal protein [Candidatus Nanohaloarchaea archaeon]
MKAVASSITKSLEVGSELVCADNSGARRLKIIGVTSRKTTAGRRSRCGISDHVKVKVLKGEQELKGEKHDAVIIRQKQYFKRGNGLRVKFEDNAAVLIESETSMPKGNRIKGVVAKEVVERYSPIGKIASMVV